MEVTKLYFKIFKKSLLPASMIYVIIFLILSVLFSNSSADSQEFSMSKVNTLVIDNDNSVLSKELSKYIADNSTPKEIKDKSETGLKDALFFRFVEYVLIIPEGFEDNFLGNKELGLKSTGLPNSYYTVIINNFVNKYINTSKLYLEASEDKNLVKALEKTKEVLSISTPVERAQGKKNLDEIPSYIYYYNYLAYPFIAIFVMVISYINKVLNDSDIKRRNNSSPISTTKFNLQIFMGNFVFAILVFLLFYIVSVILYKGNMFTLPAAFVTINALILTIFVLSLSFLISNFGKKEVVGAVSLIVSMGLCFLGGAFVPQQLLPESIKSYLVINPVFWYVKANNLIANLTNFNMDTLKPVFYAYLVQLAFAAALLGITLVIIKQKREER